MNHQYHNSVFLLLFTVLYFGGIHSQYVFIQHVVTGLSRTELLLAYCLHRLRLVLVELVHIRMCSHKIHY